MKLCSAVVLHFQQQKKQNNLYLHNKLLYLHFYHDYMVHLHLRTFPSCCQQAEDSLPCDLPRPSYYQFLLKIHTSLHLLWSNHAARSVKNCF
uniref:Uncharacterized protein n=1 Tax=Arundo donax TaxID=35708 RepID=A0A0A9F5N3_ARUDO